MSKKNIQLSFFIVLTLGLIVVSFFVFKPYLGIIFLASVFSVIFYPLYQKFIVWFKGREGLSAILTLLTIIVVIVIPAFFISASIFSEAVGLYNSFAFGGASQKLVETINIISLKINDPFLFGSSLDLNIEYYFKNILSWVISHFDSMFSVVFRGVFGFILMLLTTYYLLRSGHKIKKLIIEWSPLSDSHDEEIISTIKNSVDAVFKGRFMVAVAQGFFLWLGFVIFGIGNPVLWGFVGGVASLIPAFGTSIVTVPAIVYLFINNQIGAGIGMLVWSALAIGLVDDALTFFILKRSIKIHPIVILFSILGGVQFFGPIGFLAGPVLISALISFMKIYPFVMSTNNESS